MAYIIGCTIGYAVYIYIYVMVKTDIGIDTNRIGYHRISKGSAILWAKQGYQNIVSGWCPLSYKLVYKPN